MDDAIRWVHLLAAAVWIGGMITVAAVVPALKRAGATREQIQAAARRFGVVAWAALGASVVTGVTQLVRLSVPVKGNGTLLAKLILVGTAAALAFTHQEIARDLSPAARGAMEAVLLLLGLAILWAAVSL